MRSPRYLNLVDPDDVIGAPDESTERTVGGPCGAQLFTDGSSHHPVGDAPDDDTLPSRTSSSGVLLTVEPWEVEIGDLLIEHPYARVAHIWFAGTWLYFDADQVRIASHALAALVQVVRPQDSPQAASNPHAVNAGEVELSTPPSPALNDAPRARLIRGGLL